MCTYQQFSNAQAIYEGGCVVSTLAGTGEQGCRDGTKDQALFNYPIDVAVDKDGDIYIADRYNHRLRKITLADGTVQTVAGRREGGYKDGPAHEAQFWCPCCIAIGDNGEVFIVEDTNRVRVFSPTSNTVRSIAVHKLGRLSLWGVAITADGSVLMGDSRKDRIVKICAGGGSRDTVAGDGIWGYKDGEAHESHFRSPCGIAVSSNGDIYVADRDNHCLRKIDALTVVVSTVAGTGARGWRDGDASEAQFNMPHGLAIGSDGCVYICERDNRCIRKFDPAHGRVTTVAGTGKRGFCDGVGDEAEFSFPIGLTLGHDGVLYVADEQIHRIRAITQTKKEEPEFPEGEFENVEEKPEKKAQEMNELTEKIHEATASTLPGKAEPEFPERELEDIEKKLEKKTQEMNQLAQEIHEVAACTLAARENLEKTKDATIQANRTLAETQNALKVKRLELRAVWEQQKAELEAVESEVVKMEGTKVERVAELASVQAELGEAQTVLDKVISEKTHYAEELQRMEAQLERARVRNTIKRSTSVIAGVATGGFEDKKSEEASDATETITRKFDISCEVAGKLPEMASGVVASVQNQAPTEGPQHETAVSAERTARYGGKEKGKGFRRRVAAYEEASEAASGFDREEQHGFPGGSRRDECHDTGGTARIGTSYEGEDSVQEANRLQGA